MSKSIKIVKFPKGSTFRKTSIDHASYWGVTEFWSYINSCNDRW